MGSNIDVVNAKVQRILASEFPTELTKDGGFTLRNESARMFVHCWESKFGDEPRVIVNLTAPLLFEVKASPELFEHVALHADDYIFGHLNCSENDGEITVRISHSLLGDYLDDAELIQAIVGLLITANELDDDLQAAFGGTKFHEE